MKTMKARRRRQHGTTLVVTLVTLTAISMMAAYTLMRVLPRIRMAYQNASWQEARVAAESGIDAAMGDLLAYETGFNSGEWAGWKDEPVPKDKKGNLPPPLLPKLKAPPVEKVGQALAKPPPPPPPKPKPGKAQPPPTPPPSVISTAPSYLDNLKVSAVGAVKADVDIRLWSLQPGAAAHTEWFRIRSTATCALPGRGSDLPASLDGLLRRFNLRKVRPSVAKENAGAKSTVGLPNVTRTVEALVEPIRPFELALWTNGPLSLGTTGLWEIDSFDSRDTKKSASGNYPGRGSPFVMANGNIASSQPRPLDAPYGPLIAANGTSVRGAVATNGGDDPSTAEHENVSGALKIDPERIRWDFSRDMRMVERPAVPLVLPPPEAGPYLVGTDTEPTFYRVPGDATQLPISAAGGGETGKIVIMIDGNLDLAEPLIIPRSVAAMIYVRGNITFRNSVNSGPWSSNSAAQLLIFGDNPAGQSLQALGNGTVTAAFYGPKTNIALDGDVNWIGSLAGGSFRVNTGGDGGLHFDEALATVGPAISFRISRYIEDVRQ